MARFRLLGYLGTLILVTGCTYLEYSSVQADYAEIQAADPSQKNLKHMLERETFFVIGKTVDDTGLYPETHLAVAAYSDKFKPNERVDTMFSKGAGTHFGLNLPEGIYDLQVYADSNGDAVFDRTEIVGQRHITLNKNLYPELIVSEFDIALTTDALAAPIHRNPAAGGYRGRAISVLPLRCHPQAWRPAV